MKIMKLSDEKQVPWFEGQSRDIEELETPSVSQEKLSRLQKSTDELSELDIIAEREDIERCVESGATYAINSSWDESVISSLREYATVCGLSIDKVAAVSPDSLQVTSTEKTAVSKTELTKTADTTSETETIDEVSEGESDFSQITFDPFGIDAREAEADRQADNWEDIKKQHNLKDAPSILSNSVKPIRGGEEYTENSDIDTGRAQNSITSPDKIETFANDEVEDTGARLRRENAEREAQKAERHEEWQTEKLAALGNHDIVPKGKVFPTESLNAQPGLAPRSHSLGVYLEQDPNELPEKTVGESIAEANEQNRQKIQGAPKDAHDFNIQRETSRCVSDAFGEELKKQLGG